MPSRERPRSSPGRIARVALRFVLPAALVLAAAVAGIGAEERVTRYLVQVQLASLEDVAQLAAQGFDVAGVDRPMLLAGVVATEDDLKRLDALGWSYTVERTNAPLESIEALQDYTDPQEMSAFMDQTVAAYPNLASKITVGGPFFEGHSLYALKITGDVGQPNDRPSFILDAQHHAREVMTTEIARDMIDYLTSRYATDPQVQRWVDSINIYVIGSVNPDGAMYVFTNDNMWRKNRHPACAVDVNRNYPFAWGSCNGSSNVCSDETYRGFEPGSEPETQAMLQFTSTIQPFFTLSYHTYGEYIMYPYGCTNPDEMAAMDEIARYLNSILQADSGQTGQYRVGPIWSTIYLVDGGSIDSQYALYGSYGFTIEANSSSFQPDYATWRNVTVQRQRTAWQLFLDRTLDGPQIRGTITNAVTGQPLAGRVSVDEVTYTHGESPRHADSHGLYHWLARNGQTYHVTYSLAGYCTATRTVVVGAGPATVDVGLVPPTPPGNVAAAGNGDNRIDVSWSPAIDAVEYHVYRSLTSGGPYSEVGMVAAPATVFQDTTVSGSTTYYYVVRAMQPCDSGSSAEASASTTGVCFAGPAFTGLSSAVNALATTCSVSLTWPAATARCGGLVTYQVYRSTASPFTPSPANRIAAGLQATQLADHDALADSATYYYVVRATDSASGADDGNLVTLGATPTGPVASGTWTDDAGDTGAARLLLTAPWTVQATGGKTGPKVYATGTYTDNLCSALTTPTISVQSGAALSFASKYDIEQDWDAAIVEVAQGPAFDTWTRLTTVNYPDSLSNTGNACGFPRSFTGTVFSHSYATPAYSPSGYTGSLAAYAGKDIRLRWRIGSDGTGTGKGMWVDDIAVTNAVFRQVCASGPAASPMESGASGSPMTASRAAAGTAVDVAYGPGCGTLDNAVYWGSGPIVGSPVWTGAACALGDTGRASFDPGDPGPGGFLYFVIVGQSVTNESSYGQTFDGVSYGERPEAVGIGTCDLPQELTGLCP